MQLTVEGLSLPVRISPEAPLSLEGFWRFAGENPDLRLEREPNGDLKVMSPTHGSAGLYSTHVIRLLANWADVDGTGYALDSSTGCQLPDSSVRSADAAWISRSRWTPKRIADDEPLPAPDFVIEVRSSSDRLSPSQLKMQNWIANGVQLAWLVDPIRKAVEIYRPGQPVEVQEGHSAAYGEGPVAGFVLELGPIWN